MANKGRRLIIQHAITKHGLLAVLDEGTGRPIDVDQYASGEQLTCEMLYEGKEDGVSTT